MTAYGNRYKINAFSVIGRSGRFITKRHLATTALFWQRYADTAGNERVYFALLWLKGIVADSGTVCGRLLKVWNDGRLNVYFHAYADFFDFHGIYHFAFAFRHTQWQG